MWSPDADRGHWYWALLCNSQLLMLNRTNQINQNYCHPTIGQLNKNYLVQGLKAISHKRNRLNAFYVQMVNICNEKLITVFMKCNFELPCFLLSLNWDQAEPQHHSYGHGSCVIILWSSVLSAQVDKVSLNTTLLLLSLSLFFVIHTFYSIEWRTSKVYWHHTLRFRSCRCWLLQRNQVKVQKSVCKWKEVWWARYNNGLMWGRYPVSTELCCALRRNTRTPAPAPALCSANIGGAVQRRRLGPGCGTSSEGRGWGDQTKVAVQSYQEPATILPTTPLLPQPVY